LLVVAVLAASHPAPATPVLAVLVPGVLVAWPLVMCFSGVETVLL
jgi:hypothetical protein